MKCPYNTNCDLCGLQNHEICNTCDIMGQLMDCKFIDTSGMNKLIECEDCVYYGNGVRPTGNAPILGWFVDKASRLWEKIRR